MASYAGVYTDVILSLQRALAHLSASVPPPQQTRIATGNAYRYREKLPQQAIVLKCTRALSALIAIKSLLDEGLALDAGALMRVSDEVGSDILFLAGPLIFRHEPENSHSRYLDEFFQEEFDTPDPINSSQKRDRVSRRQVRAYVARTFSSTADVNQAVEVTRTIETTFSGYVHGAGAHTMDVYDGRSFHIHLQEGDKPLVDLINQYSQYLQRTVMHFAIASKALGAEGLFNQLYALNRHHFDDYGELR